MEQIKLMHLDIPGITFKNGHALLTQQEFDAHRRSIENAFNTLVDGINALQSNVAALATSLEDLGRAAAQRDAKNDEDHLQFSTAIAANADAIVRLTETLTMLLEEHL